MDEICNRKAVLLMMIAVVLNCSPVCEKQALFVLCKSVKENGLEPHLIKKVHMDEYNLPWVTFKQLKKLTSNFKMALVKDLETVLFFNSVF